LNSGLVVPDEIIISIPEAEAQSNRYLEAGNVKVLSVKCRGQVAQRCEGFKEARGKYVLQIDDDIIVDKECLFKLIKASETLGTNSALSPALYFLKSNESVYNLPVKSNLISKIFYSLINGKKGYCEGAITLSGTEIGINPDNHKGSAINTEWVPGGVVLHCHQNLITNNYYPHTGKAYSEDLYHSVELTKKGIELYVVPDAIAWIDDPRLDGLPAPQFWYKNLKKDYNARLYLVKMTGRSVLRMKVFYLISSFAYSIKYARKLWRG
jgi:glycosyltransferase involved in cell wall biosynthesis